MLIRIRLILVFISFTKWPGNKTVKWHSLECTNSSPLRFAQYALFKLVKTCWLILWLGNKTVKYTHLMHKPLTTLVCTIRFIKTCENLLINSLRPSDAYMHQKTRQSLVQIMAWRLFGAKPLSEPMMAYCQLDPRKHTSLKYYLRIKNFHSGKCIRNYHLRNGGHLVSASVC